LVVEGMKNTHDQLEIFAKDQEETQKRTDVAIKNLKVQMGQLPTEILNLTRKWFSRTTLDNCRNESCKMMEVEKDEEKEIDPLKADNKILEELKQMVKELTTLKVILQTRKVTRNQWCNNLLEYLFSPVGKPLCDKVVVVTQDTSKKYENTSPKKKEDPGCFSLLVIVKRFSVGKVMGDLISSATMISLSLFNKIGGMELKSSEVRIRLDDGSLKQAKGIIETMNINVDGFTFSIKVVVMELKVLDRAQMILGRNFVATARAIVNVDQGEIIIRSGEDYITYQISG